ncbi:MAG: glutamate-5-semialdehyde dehydrogenase [Paludibacteraceae bacterium]|jgi:glutamate-5-semialdehyde dehydrogenase|nr:glutamate-5-semialdehyde dehydrogenase [Paludibacteraceae bacterium]MCR5497424.1 glutamate-5-semialdehyde dehydrogenase [Paludibacteraceae bacterium]
METNELFAAVRDASKTLVGLDDAKVREVLLAVADEAEKQTDYILSENQKDLDKMDKSNPMYDRLMLTKERIAGIASDIRNVAGLPSPLGKVLKDIERPNGLKLKRISVPFGVIGVIYEARPNVSFDVFSICFKSGNACVLKGGSDAHCSNTAIVNVIHSVLRRMNVNENVVALLPAGRESTGELLNAIGYVDMIIPRGSSGLINFVREHAKIPVIETGAGVCHIYFDESGDLKIGQDAVFNGKTRRVSVCNSLDCLIINEKRLQDLPAICERMAEKNVIIYADQPSYDALKGKYPYLEPATADSYGTEFLDYKMSIKTVKNLDEALEHIAKYSSKHSEAIISKDEASIEKFDRMVDAACVYTNTSTAWTDGAQFGLGAEIGISTQKMHARGPMALEELTTYKWIIKGNGQVRS